MRPRIPGLSGQMPDPLTQVRELLKQAREQIQRIRARIDETADKAIKDELLERLTDQFHTVTEQIAPLLRAVESLDRVKSKIPVRPKPVLGGTVLPDSEVAARNVADLSTKLLDHSLAPTLEAHTRNWVGNVRLLCVTIATTDIFDWGLVAAELGKSLELELRKKVALRAGIQPTTRNREPTLGDFAEQLGTNASNWPGPEQRKQLADQISRVSKLRNGAVHGEATHTKPDDVHSLAKHVLPNGDDGLLLRVVRLK